MKKILLIATLLVAGFTQQVHAQDSTQQKGLSQLLTQYYSIKDALVVGNGNRVSAFSEGFLKLANSIDYKVVSEGNINALLTDATAMSETKDIKKQRLHFENLSGNMAALAKSVKLSAEPIYVDYCPMKKASWLSMEPTIKNPYFGSSMLTCGNIIDTLR